MLVNNIHARNPQTSTFKPHGDAERKCHYFTSMIAPRGLEVAFPTPCKRRCALFVSRKEQNVIWLLDFSPSVWALPTSSLPRREGPPDALQSIHESRSGNHLHHGERVLIALAVTVSSMTGRRMVMNPLQCLQVPLSIHSHRC